MRHFKSFDLNFERLFCSFKRKQFDLNCFSQGFSLKTDIHKKFESILFLKLQKVESEIRFENPLCFELNFKKSKMHLVTLQSVILKHFENGSKVFLKWLFGKDRLKKNNLSCLISNFIWKVFKMLSRYFTKVWKNRFKSLQQFAFGNGALLALN